MWMHLEQKPAGAFVRNGVFPNSEVLLTVEHMAQADEETIASGTSGHVLMERAGAAVVHEICHRWKPGRASVLCGPGNNGGDGYVIARLLDEAGWVVRVFSYGAVDRLTGDAAVMAERWEREIESLQSCLAVDVDLVVDALFGAGLSRPLDGEVTRFLDSLTAPCVAVDIPSGVDGNSGKVFGGAVMAELTVTFCRAKPGHFLLPGRVHCGELVVADIGIPDSVVQMVDACVGKNGPDVWVDRFPWPALDAHKYRRGHLVVAGGGIASSGAARLSARAGLRVGAGLVTCAVPPSAVMVYAAHLTSIMIKPLPDQDAFSQVLSDRRVTALVLGPGQGLGHDTRGMVMQALKSAKPIVLDADALSAFADGPGVLLSALHERCVLTPHEGEFARLFERTDDRLGDARDAAIRCGAVVVLKGPDTIVAHPDGRALINANAPPELATAGSGDVLAGFIGGLLAQGLDAFDAAATGVWLHGAVGREGGPGLIAEDLPDLLPMVLCQLKVWSS
jgi:ADP-dependent NAD(P)H-hydrate dehydratase / NAD(P)H-hydrate epimerase